MTQSQVREPDRDVERLQRRPDVTKTDRQDESGLTKTWTVKERTDQRGMMREGESREEETKVSSSKIDGEE